MKLILDLCGGSGSWSLPYKNAGYIVQIVTFPYHDVRTFTPPPGVDGILAAPPCESFSRAPNPNGGIARGSRHTQMDGMEIVNACLRIINQCKPAFWALENPTGDLRKYLGKPRFTFQPYEFGDGWTKRTDIWGNFNIPTKTHTWETCPKLELYTRPGRNKPGIASLHRREIMDIPQLAWASSHCKTDADARAVTPPGFTTAFFNANR